MAQRRDRAGQRLAGGGDVIDQENATAVEPAANPGWRARRRPLRPIGVSLLAKVAHGSVMVAPWSAQVASGPAEIASGPAQVGSGAAEVLATRWDEQVDQGQVQRAGDASRDLLGVVARQPARRARRYPGDQVGADPGGK